MSIFFGGDTTCAHLASNIQLGFFYWWYFPGTFNSWDRSFWSDLETLYVFQIMVLFSVEKPAHHASQVWSQWDQGDFYITFKNGRRKAQKKTKIILKNMKKKTGKSWRQVIKFRVVGGEMGATSSLAPKVWFFVHSLNIFLLHYCLFDWPKWSFHF